VLLVSAGHVVARPGPVFDAIVARSRAFRDAGGLVVADPVSSLVVLQGRCWYRAEIRIVPDDTGSRVEETVVNVARRAHRLVPLIGRRALADAPVRFQRMLRELRQELE
jgi:hypothetical protein